MADQCDFICEDIKKSLYLQHDIHTEGEKYSCPIRGWKYIFHAYNMHKKNPSGV